MPASEREALYNLSLALKLPAQSLGLLESLVASELADFTIHDRNLSRELDPRLPNEKASINVTAILTELNRNDALEKRLRPLFTQIVGAFEANDDEDSSIAEVDDRL